MSVTETPLKLLLVIDYFRDPWAGTEGQFYQLIKGLDRRVIEPEVLVLEASPWLQENGLPCPWTELGHRRLSSPLTWLALWRKARAFRRRGFRLAHVYFNDASIICPPVFRMAGLETWISRRDMGYWYTPMLKQVLRLTRRFARGAIVNSEAVKKITMAAEGYRDDQVKVIYNGYNMAGSDAQQPPPEPEPFATLRASNAVIAVLVANIRPIKRMQDAVEAVSQVQRQNPDCNLHLVIIGDGDPSSLQELADSLSVADRVHFTGARQDVGHCLPHADIGLLCSESEGFSNALVEYLMAGLPVVCSNVGGNGEAVEQGINGFLYPAGDVEALSGHLSTLTDQPDKRQQFGQQGRASARQRFALQTMILAHQTLYLESAGQHSELAGEQA